MVMHVGMKDGYQSLGLIMQDLENDEYDGVAAA